MKPRSAMAAALLATCALASTGPAHAQEMMEHDADEARVLEVSGQASVPVATDRVRISFAVQTEAETARESTAANAELMDAVLRALRATDAPGLTLETAGFTLQPVYARPDERGRPVVDGYRTANTVQVTADDVEVAGSLVDAAVEAGANRVASLTFEASNTEEARLEALRMAVQQARQEAEVMAEALGEELGAPLEVRGGAERPSPPRPMVQFRTAEAQSAPTPMEPGEQTVTASVTIRYRLGR